MFEGAIFLVIFSKLIFLAVVVAATYFFNIFVSNLLDKYFLTDAKNTRTQNQINRNKTVREIIKVIIKYLLYFNAILILLSSFGINTSTILATAGVGGLAIGFGAQSLVKDVITGFFILLENQYSIGDYIVTSGYEGIVEEFGIRVTKLRALSGEICIIPNGQIIKLSNFSKGSRNVKVVLSIAYEQDVDRAMKVIREVCEEIKTEFPQITDGPSVLGITDFGASSVDITVLGKAPYLDTFGVEREIRRKVKYKFDELGIEIPYSKVQIVSSNN